MEQVVLEVSLQWFKQDSESSGKFKYKKADRLFGPLKQHFGVQKVEMAVREWLPTQGHFLLSMKYLNTCQDRKNASM